MSSNAKKVALLIAVLVLGGGAVAYNLLPSAEDKAESEKWAKIRADREKAAAAEKANPTAAPKEGDPEVASQFDVADVDIEALLQNIQDVEFEYNLERLSRDPMSPLIGLQAASESGSGSSQPQIGADERLLQTARLKAVSGIVWDDASPMAVIDNEVVTEGYAYPEGIVLDEILPDHVVFRVNNARVEVELKEQ